VLLGAHPRVLQEHVIGTYGRNDVQLRMLVATRLMLFPGRGNKEGDAAYDIAD
jgi:hypothetical protein